MKNNTIIAVALLALLGLLAVPAIRSDPVPQGKIATQPMSPYDVAIYQRDQSTKALQDAQLQLALKIQEVDALRGQVDELKKEIDALKAKAASNPSAGAAGEPGHSSAAESKAEGKTK
jgi:peptidoglycan hydrolase CwlO-like protein